MNKQVFLLTGIVAWLGAGVVAAADFEYSLRGPEQLDVRGGAVVEADFDALATSLDESPGINGWCIGLSMELGEIVDITTEGTQVPDFLLDDGFQKSELTSGPGNEGAVSCVLLSRTNSEVVLPPLSTTHVARLRARITMPAECATAALRFVDGLVGSFGPVSNEVIRPGARRVPRLRDHLISLVPGGRPCGEPEPQGWVPAGDWNLLFPLANPYGCDGGGEETLLRNWLEPHDPRREAPLTGEEWPDIDFGGRALVTAYEAAQLLSRAGESGDPVWVTLEWLAARGLTGGAEGCDPEQGLLNCEQIDWRALTLGMSRRSAELGIPAVPTDNLLGLAQTYLENRTGSPVCVAVCAQSQDALQVWVNEQLAISESRCDLPADDCADAPLAVLEPGVNRLTVLSWQGTGEWRFGLRLLDPATREPILREGRDDIAFLGPHPAPVQRTAISVTRRVSNPDGCPSKDLVVVTFTGDGRGEGTEVSLTEELDATRGAVGEVLAVSAGGTATRTAAGWIISWTVPAELLNLQGVSYDLELPSGQVAMPVGIVNGCAAVGGARQIAGARAHSGQQGLLDDAHDVGSDADIGDEVGALIYGLGLDETQATSDDLFTLRVGPRHRRRGRLLSLRVPAPAGRFSRHDARCRQDLPARRRTPGPLRPDGAARLLAHVEVLARPRESGGRSRAGRRSPARRWRLLAIPSQP